MTTAAALARRVTDVVLGERRGQVNSRSRTRAKRRTPVRRRGPSGDLPGHRPRRLGRRGPERGPDQRLRGDRERVEQQRRELPQLQADLMGGDLRRPDARRDRGRGEERDLERGRAQDEVAADHELRPHEVAHRPQRHRGRCSARRTAPHRPPAPRRWRRPSRSGPGRSVTSTATGRPTARPVDHHRLGVHAAHPPLPASTSSTPGIPSTAIRTSSACAGRVRRQHRASAASASPSPVMTSPMAAPARRLNALADRVASRPAAVPRARTSSRAELRRRDTAAGPHRAPSPAAAAARGARRPTVFPEQAERLGREHDEGRPGRRRSRAGRGRRPARSARRARPRGSPAPQARDLRRQPPAGGPDRGHLVPPVGDHALGVPPASIRSPVAATSMVTEVAATDSTATAVTAPDRS